MILRHPEKQLTRARSMRRQPPHAEEMLWRSLRGSRTDVKFRRQVPIGSYIADFACLSHKLIVELDGPPHADATQQAHDLQRDAWLHDHGWGVLRVSNDIVIGGGNIVLDLIKRALQKHPSSDLAARGHLLPQAGEGAGAH